MNKQQVEQMRAQQTKRIAVALPTHDMVPAKFMFDLANMVAFSTAKFQHGEEFGLNMIAGTYVHAARQKLLALLIAQGVTHVLWVDTDMSFPRDALLRLLNHRKDVVGINYAKREAPPEYVAFKHVDIAGGNSTKLATLPESTGLEKVDALGFGMVLMRTEPLLDLPDPRKEPWFFFEYLPGGRTVGEDVFFCRILRERLGLDIYVDHDLSKECSHIGQFPYRLEHVGLEVDG